MNIKTNHQSIFIESDRASSMNAGVQTIRFSISFTQTVNRTRDILEYFEYGTRLFGGCCRTNANNSKLIKDAVRRLPLKFLNVITPRKSLACYRIQ